MAFYSDDIIEEVKSANDIVDVVSSYVNLRRRGTTFFGPCPFHREKTPSFAVNPEKQIYHCFGCGEGGNVIRFIMRAENLSFQDAMQFLADRAKIELPNNDINDIGLSQDELVKRDNHKKQMYEINREAGRFFYNNIEKSQKAKDYIEKRKLDKVTVIRFGLGFALSDNGLTKFLLSKGFKEEDMIATGLVGKNERGVLYDKFKDRFMFPIFDIMDRVIGFGGRALESHDELKKLGIPKYVNSPENLIYSKGKHLYGLNVAKKMNQKMKRIIVVEGYMDVISPNKAGVTNIVASLGTALTESQARLIRKYADEVILSYDSDQAGQKAIERGIEVLQPLGITTKVLQMEGAKDPDEYVLKYGPEKFERLVDKSITAIEFKVKNLSKDYNLDDTTDKIRFLNKMAQILSKVENNIERDIYVDKLSSDLGVGKEAILSEIDKLNFKNKANLLNWQEPKPASTKKMEDMAPSNEIEELIIFLLCEKNTETYRIIKSKIEVDDFSDEVNKRIVKKLYDEYENGDIINIDIMNICESDEDFNRLSKILMNDNFVDDNKKILDEVLTSFINNKLQKKKMFLMEKIKSSSGTEQERYVKELNDVIKQQSEIT